MVIKIESGSIADFFESAEGNGEGNRFGGQGNPEEFDLGRTGGFGLPFTTGQDFAHTIFTWKKKGPLQRFDQGIQSSGGEPEQGLGSAVEIPLGKDLQGDQPGSWRTKNCGTDFWK